MESQTYATKEFGEVPFIEAVAVRAPDTGAITVFAINRHLAEPLPLTLDLAIIEHVTLTDSDPLATNTAAQPDRITPCRAPQPGILPPLSWNVIHLQIR